ncbi:MAG: hypothetical protein WD231_02295 [Candidatus Woykebacteria bacterium]
MKKKPTKEEVENFTNLFNTLNSEAEKQKSMTKLEKKNNSIKMGEIYY